MSVRIARRFVVLGVVFMAVLVGCGDDDGETKTVTVEATEAETETEASALERVTGPLTVRAVRKCLADAGADVQDGPADLGEGGTGVFAIGPAGTQMGVAIANNAAIGKELARQLAAEGGYEVNRVPDDPKVVVMFSGSVDPDDRAVVDECIGGSGS